MIQTTSFSPQSMKCTASPAFKDIQRLKLQRSITHEGEAIKTQMFLSFQL